MQGNGAKQPKPLQMKNHQTVVFTQGINFWNQNIEVQWYFFKKNSREFSCRYLHYPGTLLFVIPFVILLPYINFSALRSITLICEEFVVLA